MSVHSKYADGTVVLKSQRPLRLGQPEPDPNAIGSHSQVRWDTKNQRIYQLREFDESGQPVRDIDLTSPTYPNGNLRPGPSTTPTSTSVDS